MDYSKPFRYITEIAKYQSISIAAEKLAIQQPSLSKYLKKVETELGTELFDRTTTPIKLTEAGQCYLEAARRVIDADNQLQKQVSDIIGQKATLHIGISPSRAPYLLPSVIKQFRNIRNNVNIVIHEETTDELNKGLSSGALDLIISVKDSNTSHFTAIKLFDETLLLAVPDNYSDNNFRKAISELTVISPGKGQILSNELIKIEHFDSSIECQNIITAISMVQNGLGATIIPSYIADYGTTEHVKFIPIPKESMIDIEREVFIFHRQAQILNESEKLFIQTAVSVTK